MTPSAASADSSFLLWALGAAVVLLAAHLLLGWLRQAQAVPGWRKLAKAAVGAVSFGLAVNIGCTLTLQSESFAFPLGYGYWQAAALMLAGSLAVLPLALLPAYRPGLLSAILTGPLVGGAVVVLQAGWIEAVGFRPGVFWRPDLLLAAWGIASAGTAAGFALALPSVEQASLSVSSWRLGATALVALGYLAGASLVVSAAGLSTQVGSVYRHQVSGTVLSLVGGGLLPLVLVTMVVDLELRRIQRRRLRRQRHRKPYPNSQHDSLLPVSGLPSEPGALAPETADVQGHASEGSDPVPISGGPCDPVPTAARPSEATPSVADPPVAAEAVEAHDTGTSAKAANGHDTPAAARPEAPSALDSDSAPPPAPTLARPTRRSPAARRRASTTKATDWSDAG